jgi:hypothetical protein
MADDLEQLAHEASLRALDKQERLLEELRARTGILLAASSVAVSFLGNAVKGERGSELMIVAALMAFVVSVGAGAYVLAPKPNLIFSLSGPRLYERFYDARMDMSEAHRGIAYTLHRFWEHNDRHITGLIAAYKAATTALVVEISLLVVLVVGKVL